MATPIEEPTTPSASNVTPPIIAPDINNNNLAAIHERTNDAASAQTSVAPHAVVDASTDEHISADSYLPTDAPRLRVANNPGGRGTLPVVTYRDATKCKSRKKTAASAPVAPPTPSIQAKVATPVATAPATPTGS